MRILHLIHRLSGGGAERQLCYLAPEQRRMGHDVHVAYSIESHPESGMDGVELSKLRKISNYDPNLLIQLVDLMRRIRPDVVQTWILQMDVLGGSAALITGAPWILREPSSSMGYKPSLKHRLRRLLGSRAEAVVSNSEGGRDYWTSRSPRPLRFVVRNGLPIREMLSVHAGMPEGLSRTTLPIVLFAGRLTEGKNIEKLLEAVSNDALRREMMCVICGDGPQRGRLEREVRERGLDSIVRFAGQLPAAPVWALMKKASAFVSLSEYEGCPNSVMEAMACGCPLVVSAIHAHREILDESSAMFVDQNDVGAVVTGILLALVNREEALERAANALAAANEFTIGAMAREYDKVYEQVLRSRGCAG